MPGTIELPLIITAKDEKELRVIEAKIFSKVNKQGEFGIVNPKDKTKLFLGISLEKISNGTGENGVKTSQILVKADNITFMDSITLGKHLQHCLKGHVKTIEFCMEDCPVDEYEIQEILLTNVREFAS